MKAGLTRISHYVFFGGPSKWYLGPEVTPETRAAVIEWLNDRTKLHTWITSVAIGTIVFLAALGPTTNVQTIPGLFKVIGLGLMLVSVTVNIVCVWSLSNWKYNVSTGIVSDGSRMRLDIEVVGWIAIGSFLSGLVVAVIPIVI